MGVKHVMKKKRPDYVDVDIEAFYAETIGGAGGAPRGLERDLITKYFGNGDHVGRGDHDAALKALRAKMEEGTSFKGPDDGQGWIWLVADLNLKVGLDLELRKETPFGKRPVLVARQDNVAEVFDKVDWSVVRRRFNEVLGVRDMFNMFIKREKPTTTDDIIMANLQ
uniref:Uncharacterized protein n=1 Tax=Zooxanthella nutricula TaxID=1333877 RepID=A0A7S2PB35_9DINO